MKADISSLRPVLLLKKIVFLSAGGGGPTLRHFTVGDKSTERY